jgi:hypothetical protein
MIDKLEQESEYSTAQVFLVAEPALERNNSALHSSVLGLLDTKSESQGGAFAQVFVKEEDKEGPTDASDDLDTRYVNLAMSLCWLIDCVC